VSTRFVLQSDSVDFAMLPAFLGAALPIGLLDGAAEARLRLAVHELLTNISRHAYGDVNGAIEIEISPLAEAVQLTVTDSGRPFRGEIAPGPPVHSTTGGYGLSIISEAADDVEYRRRGPVNRWKLVFRSRTGTLS